LSSRTGQFGIGVLSYYDRDLRKSRRSNLAEDTDPTGWFFETEGVGAGELRQDTRGGRARKCAYN